MGDSDRDPSSLREIPQECKDIAMWQKHLAIAHYLLLGLGVFIGVFTDKYLVGFTMVLAALSLYFLSGYLEAKHLRWHVEQELKKPKIKARVYYQKDEEDDNDE